MSQDARDEDGREADVMEDDAMTTEAGATALLFPGQGTQRQGMGEPWRATESWELVPELSELTGTDVEELLLKADDDTLRRTDLAQIAVFAVSLMAYEEAVRLGLAGRDAVCAGHSLGEYTALVAAGALSYRDAARLVAARGSAMRDAAAERQGTMAVLFGVEEEAAAHATEAAREAGDPVWVANLNSPGQVVLSGTEAGLDHAARLLQAPGVKRISIPVGGAFHSPLMAPAAERLEQALAGAEFISTGGCVVANVDAAAHSEAADWPRLLVRQLVSPVRWEDGVRTLLGPLGRRRLVEIGPGKTLTGLVRRISREPEVVTFNAPDAVRG
ncbi:ACP S-malonyltransferase [Streptomyces sp. NPDC053367]|uniref:ACP S-malonyltransferase n=1 Tax=Streptomyces sp. NPDC053367 TaxID=3365700 RepID=UPI0037D7ED58